MRKESIIKTKRLLVGPEDIADLLGVSLTWVLTHSQPSSKYRLPVVKVGGLLRFDPNAVLQHIKKEQE